MSKFKFLLISFYFYSLFVQFFLFYCVSQSSSIFRLLFRLFVNSKLSLASLHLNFIFCTHCPASNSPAIRGQCFCNVICLLIKFFVVVFVSAGSIPEQRLVIESLGPATLTLLILHDSHCCAYHALCCSLVVTQQLLVFCLLLCTCICQS